MAKKKKILIIDDNPRIYDNFINVLREEYDISVSDNLISATRQFEMFHFDLVIIDIMMSPHGLGLKTTNAYHTGLNFYHNYIRLQYPDLIVVFWSALSNNTIIKYFSDKGGVPKNLHYVDKYDYTQDEFKSFVRSILPPKTNIL